MTCPHCAILQAKIRQLEAASRKERGVRIIAELATRFNINEQPARVLAALYRAGGRVLSRDYLQDVVLPRGAAEACNSKHLDVVVCKIRRAAGFDAIQTHPGLGYSITALGRLVCDEALESRAVAA